MNGENGGVGCESGGGNGWSRLMPQKSAYGQGRIGRARKASHVITIWKSDLNTDKRDSGR